MPAQLNSSGLAGEGDTKVDYHSSSVAILEAKNVLNRGCLWSCVKLLINNNQEKNHETSGVCFHVIPFAAHTLYIERKRNLQTGAHLHWGPTCFTDAVLRKDDGWMEYNFLCCIKASSVIASCLPDLTAFLFHIRQALIINSRLR